MSFGPTVRRWTTPSSSTERSRSRSIHRRGGDLVEISAQGGASLEVGEQTVHIPPGQGLQREIVKLEMDAPITRLSLRSTGPVRVGHLFMLRDFRPQELTR
jgi:hypothetical protein